MNGQGRGPSTAEITERRIRAWQMQLAGKSYRDIATELGVSVGTAFKDVQAHAEAIKTPVAEAVRKQELARLDMLIERLMPRIESGDVQAVGAFLKVMDRRAKMLGLDAPTKQEINVPQIDVGGTALGELLAEYRARQAAEEQALKDGAE
jgi:hypothetical protein